MRHSTSSSPWDRRISMLFPAMVAPTSNGFVSDSELQKLIKKAMGDKPPRCPKDTSRTRLLEVATTLNLISTTDAATLKPVKGSKTLTW